MISNPKFDVDGNMMPAFSSELILFQAIVVFKG